MEAIPFHLKRQPWYTKKIEACPDKDKHEYGPENYVEWHDWAEKKCKTHKQLKCKCGLYVIWELKRG